MIRTVLTDAQWAVIAPHCLGRECDPGRTGPDPRRFVEAVLWISRTGCPWVSVRCAPPNGADFDGLVSTIDSGHLGALYGCEAEEAALAG